MTLEPQLTLTMPATAENVPLARRALAGVAEALALDPALVGDISIAVTEACANTVVHAYRGGAGLVALDVSYGDGNLIVTVRDQGAGMTPDVEGEREGLGVGLSLMATLADGMVIRSAPDEGTQVRMGFSPGESDIAVPELDPSRLLGETERPPDGAVSITVEDGPLAAPVIGRVVALMAARSNFPIDRLGDAQALTDVLAESAGTATTDGLVRLHVGEGERALTLRVGPLRPEGGNALIAASEVPGLGRLVERLSDGVEISPVNGGEYLDLTVSAAD